MSRAVFTQGSTLRHVLRMTAAGATGLVAMFAVDLADMYFLSLLGDQDLVAAVGFGTTLMFFLLAINIGLQIGMGALVSRAEGSGERELAGRYCTNSLVYAGLAASAVAVPLYVFLPEILQFLGARGRTLEFALAYTRIIVPAAPVLALGMSAANAARALGDARRSMYATLGGSAVNAALDPLLIFGLGWGIEGAATASVIARFVVLGIAGHAIVAVHRLPGRTSWPLLRADAGRFLSIAGPAIMTNLATPVGSSVVIKVMARFGDDAVAGAAIMGRITPAAFAAVFAMSGAIGPIVGQNAGAGRYDRVRRALLDTLMCNAVYVMCVWLLLWLLADAIVAAFSAAGQAEQIIRFYVSWLPGAYLFSGMLFVANASFNNLHQAHLATLLNFGRALLGTIPGVYLGASLFGARGVLAGEALGAVVFGCIGFAAILWYVGRLERAQGAAGYAAGPAGGG